ncbi:MAG TPA: formate dehydrogenase accessory protein FdhE [Candidatus Dormibacteraeota bacterium]|jgi:FdhE protein|nr:formate dehydrogenase accessory protein FdhE [Candidatus Dormibacteraeota bacterium]
MAAALHLDTRWEDRRRRGAELIPRYPFAAEVLRLHGALLDVQERAFARAPALAGLDEVAAHAAHVVLPEVVEATAAAGPESLGERAAGRLREGGLEEMVGAWLAGEEQDQVERYLARAAASPVLEAAGDALAPAEPADARHCPRCGGLPQLAVIEPGETLTGSRRRLVCSRCLAAWAYPRMVCAGCGETETRMLPIYEEGDWIPHARVEGCESCRRYLISVDLRRDPDAVPLVDELAAMPLALHAESLGLTKIMPNLMGL